MSKSTTHSAIIITAFIVTSVINYGFSVALSWFFSPAQFGMLGVAQSLLLTLGLTVGSGFAWLIAHEVATSGVTDETLRNFRTALVANCILGFMLMLGLWFAYLSKLLPLGSEYHLVIPLVGLATLLLAFRAVLNGAMRGLYQFGPLSVNLVGEAIAKAAIGLILVKAGFGVAGVMIGFVCGAGAGLLHSLWIIRPSKFWRGKGWFDIKVVPAALPLFLGMLGPALMMNLDLLGLRILAPASQGNELAGHYQDAVIDTHFYRPVINFGSVFLCSEKRRPERKPPGLRVHCGSLEGLDAPVTADLPGLDLGTQGCSHALFSRSIPPGGIHIAHRSGRCRFVVTGNVTHRRYPGRWRPPATSLDHRYCSHRPDRCPCDAAPTLGHNRGSPVTPCRWIGDIDWPIPSHIRAIRFLVP